MQAVQASSVPICSTRLITVSFNNRILQGLRCSLAPLPWAVLAHVLLWKPRTVWWLGVEVLPEVMEGVSDGQQDPASCPMPFKPESQVLPRRQLQ